MTSTRSSGGTRPGPADPPGWEESLSREIEDLAGGARRLASEWEKRFGREAFQNPLFAGAYLELIRGHSILGVLRAVHEREAPEGERPSRSFEERLEGSLEIAGTSRSVPDPVPVSLFHYLERLVNQARAQMAKGLLVDPEPLVRILKFGRPLLDLPALSAFRIDLLERFPTGTGAPEAEEEAEASLTLPKGYRLGKVEIVRLLGEGGFAQVYLVYHPGLKEHRAAKIFTKLQLLGPQRDQIRKSFYDEAQLQNQLKHPSIVRVLDVDDHSEFLTLIMEYVEGRNLRSLIDERRQGKTHLSAPEILRIALDVARGLEFAHAKGIIHRDIKPENILVATDGQAKISDFGLAKPLDDSGERRTTRLGYLIGTPHYMAPEQAFGEVYDHRVDLYSFGAVLYHMAYGEPPFGGKDVWKVLDRHRSEKPVPLTVHLEDFPGELDGIILRLLEKDPGNRYSTAGELVAALAGCQERLGERAPGVPRPRAARRRTAWAIPLLVLGLLLGGGVLAFRTGRTPQPPKSPPVAQGPGERRPGPEREAAEPATLKGEISTPVPPPPPGAEPSGAPPPAQPPPAPAPEDPVGRPPPTPKKAPEPEPKPPSAALRELLARYPISAEESAFTLRILELFTSHRAELLSLDYEDLARDLDRCRPPQGSQYGERLRSAARELLGLSGDLVRERWKDLSQGKSEIRLALAGGQAILGTVEKASDRSLTIAGREGGKTTVELAKVAPEEFLRGTTLPAAEVALQALSGDAGRALAQSIELAKEREREILAYPVLVRLARLSGEELARSTLEAAEAGLAQNLKKGEILKALPAYPRFVQTLRALEQAKPEVISLYPHLEPEFAAALREGEALRLVLDGESSRVLEKYPGTRAAPVASTMLLADFLRSLDAGKDELLASRGWIVYAWELRPDLPSIQERLQVWDTLEAGGCVLRDPKGPRSLIMGRPHPRAGEGILVSFQFEPLGEEGAAAEWRLNLKRAGGGNSTIKFEAGKISLSTLSLDPGEPDRILAQAKAPGLLGEPRTHALALIPGEGLHVFLDGAIVATFPIEDARLPSQISLVVLHGKLEARSILARKKPAK